MPELPEVEHLRRSLEPSIRGAHVQDATILRHDYIRIIDARIPRPQHILKNARIRQLHRHGKQLAIEADDERTIVIHLGMSGQLRFLNHRQRLGQHDHVHCIWRIVRAGRAIGRLILRDPRRFGGVQAYPSMDAVHEHAWSALGPDALDIDAASLSEALGRTDRAIKVALLDQQLLAGVGNIYADEILHEAGIHPLTRSKSLNDNAVDGLLGCMGRILRAAVEAGGSTLRDYVDADGKAGAFTSVHKAYGRAGATCFRCGASRLKRITVAQRSTTFCPQCQPYTQTIIHKP